MKKRLLIMVLSVSTIISLCACGENAVAPAVSPDGANITSDMKEDAQSGSETKESTTDDASAEAEPESIGNAYFTPGSDGVDMLIGADTMHAYFEAADVFGAGTLTIMNADTKETAMTLDLSKACEAVSPDDISSHLSWDNGTHLVIHMDAPLDKQYDYYVTLSEGAFKTKDQTKASKAITDDKVWHFGFTDFGIKLDQPNGSDVFVEDRIPMTVYVEGDAKKAVMEDFDENRVRFGDKDFEKTKETEIKIYQIGEDSFTAAFYDNEGALLGKIPVSYNAALPPTPEDEVPEHSVIGL